jgi:hypothetical protein
MINSYKSLSKKEIERLIALLAWKSDMKITVKFDHVYERMVERNIELADLIENLTLLINNYFEEWLYDIQFKNEDEKPFRMEVKSKKVTTMFSRADDVWKLTTVLDTNIHHRYVKKNTNNFYAIIDMTKYNLDTADITL